MVNYGPRNPHTYRFVENGYDIFTGTPEEVAKKYIDELVNYGFFDNHQLTQHFYFNEQHERSSDNIDIYIDFSDLENELKKKIDKDLNVLKLNVKPTHDKELYRIVFKPYEKKIMMLYVDDLKLYQSKLIKPLLD